MFNIAHLCEKVWGEEVESRISDKRVHTGLILVQRKNLCAESCCGCVQRWHMGESKMCHLCSLLFVMQVFLRTKNCKSLASMSLLVFANFMICLWSLSGGIWCVDENFVKLDQSASTKELLQINLENSLQPLMFGEVSCSMG